MKSKLVYVLTCAPEKFYIEQALISAFSARHWNPDAHIVLLVDDKTDALLVDKRSEILDYVSEKIVVPFEDATLSPMYRSRYIKTSVRQRISGDFLFIDSDTIICRSLADIDGFTCEVGAVWESHLLVEDYCDSLLKAEVKSNMRIGVDIVAEKEYFSSGVLYVKDTSQTHRLYEQWHQFWKESQVQGLAIDQPSLAKANRECGHVIKRIPDTYNCILFTENDFTRRAHVLHISAFRNPSYLFTDKVLNFVKENGIENEWIIASVLNPCATFLPFDYDFLHSSLRKRLGWMKELAAFSKGYGQNIDGMFTDFPMVSRFRMLVVWCLKKELNWMGAGLWMLWKRIHLLGKKDLVKGNACRK